MLENVVDKFHNSILSPSLFTQVELTNHCLKL